jgi:hypothetical protein
VSSSLRTAPSRRASLAWLAVVVVVVSGCAHGVEIHSDPPGAAVFVDDEPVGTTPMTLEQMPDVLGHDRVTLRYGDQEARFDLERAGWSTEHLLGGVIGGAVGSGVGMTGMVGGYMMIVIPVLTLLGGPPAIILPIVAVGAVLLATGATIASLSAYAPFLVAGELSRVGPDRVEVNFHSGAISTTPPGQARRRVGVSAGYRPLRGPREDERGGDEEQRF